MESFTYPVCRNYSSNNKCNFIRHWKRKHPNIMNLVRPYKRNQPTKSTSLGVEGQKQTSKEVTHPNYHHNCCCSPKWKSHLEDETGNEVICSQLLQLLNSFPKETGNQMGYDVICLQLLIKLLTTSLKWLTVAMPLLETIERLLRDWREAYHRLISYGI